MYGQRQHKYMGKVLGGGSSINVMVWAREHRSDWNYFADEAGDEAWNYASVLKIYQRDGKRLSVFRSYTYPRMAQPKLTVLTNALVSRLTFEHRKVTGVEVIIDGQKHTLHASREVVLSLGAVNTPKLLMQSGIGPEQELGRHGIAVRQHLAGVGQNHQNHVSFGCIWEYQECCIARWSSRCRARKMRGAACLSMAGPWLPAWLIPRAAAKYCCRGRMSAIRR